MAWFQQQGITPPDLDAIERDVRECAAAEERDRARTLNVELRIQRRQENAWRMAWFQQQGITPPDLDAIERDVRECAAAEERDRATATVTPVADPPASSTPTADEAQRTTRVAFRDSKGTKVRT